MTTYSFYAVKRDLSRYEYPTQLRIEAASKAEAVNRVSVENGLKVTDLGEDYVWMETPDGVDVKYTVTQRE